MVWGNISIPSPYDSILIPYAMGKLLAYVTNTFCFIVDILMKLHATSDNIITNFNKMILPQKIKWKTVYNNYTKPLKKR